MKEESIMYDFEKYKQERNKNMRFEKEHPILSYILDLRYVPYRIYSYIVNIPREVKWFIQRGMRGWAECDAWDFYNYNAKVCREVILDFRVNKGGTPCDMFVIKENRNPTKKEELTAKKKWDNILGKMFYAFDLICKIGEGEREFFSPCLPQEKQMNLKCLTRRENEGIQEGLRLFTKHYFSLWD